MVNIDASNRTYIGQSQKVYVNGSLSNILKCTSCDNQKASFIVPELRFDSRTKHNLQGKKVSVYCNGVWKFTGFLDTTNADLSPDADGFTIDATSVTEKLSHIWVGQTQNKNVLTFRKTDGWTLYTILRELFDNLGSYSNILSLGDCSIIQDKDYDYNKELILRNCTLEEAIDQILAYAGNVVYNPVFNASGARLDLYRSADNRNGTSFAEVAGEDEDIIYANVESLNCGDSSADTIDQVTVFGAPKKFIITVRGNADPGAFPVQMSNDWDASIEAFVRANPDVSSKREAPAYVTGAEFVDKRFKLPAILQDKLKLQDLPINKDAEGKQKYKLQAFQFKATVGTSDPDLIKTTYAVDALPTQVDADFDLDNNVVIFKEPATNVVQVDYTDIKTPKYTYAPAQVGITIGIESEDHLLYHRTNTSKSYPHNINVLREDYEFVQYTNDGYAFEDGTVFDNVIIFTEDVSPPAINVLTEALVIKDDSGKIQKLAQEVLKERNVRAKTLSVNIPFVTSHYKVGNKLVVKGLENGEFNDDEFSITNVSYDLDTYNTSITADNSKPLKYSDV